MVSDEWSKGMAKVSNVFGGECKMCGLAKSLSTAENLRQWLGRCPSQSQRWNYNKNKNTDLRKTRREKSFTDIFHSAVACQELPMPGRSPNLARNEITFRSFQFADYDFLSPSTHPPPHLSFKITVITNPTFLSTILLLVLSRSLKSPLR